MGIKKLHSVKNKICWLAAFALFAVPVSYAKDVKNSPPSSLPTVLFIGDSHTVGTFGIKEDALLRSLPSLRVETYAVCGSSPHNWFQSTRMGCGYFFKNARGVEQHGIEIETPQLTRLLDKHHPKFTLVALGANMFGGPDYWIKSSAVEMAQTIVSSGSQCIWIAPPQRRGNPEPESSRLFNEINAAVSPYCAVIDSRKYAAYPDNAGDGIHYDLVAETGPMLAGKWADGIFRELKPLLKNATSKR